MLWVNKQTDRQAQAICSLHQKKMSIRVSERKLERSPDTLGEQMMDGLAGSGNM